MSNTFMENLRENTNYTITENGAVARKSTLSALYDMFAFGGAYRNRTDQEVEELFENAYAEDPLMALKCSFYLRDCRGGQGERRFFRVAYRKLCKIDAVAAYQNLENIPEFGRWDDLWHCVDGTPLWHQAMAIIANQLALDLECDTPSLLAKWLPSENASSIETKRMAGSIRKSLGLTHKQYRQALSKLRKRINIVERLMSEGKWDEIEFDKIPSKAGISTTISLPDFTSDAISKRKMIISIGITISTPIPTTRKRVLALSQKNIANIPAEKEMISEE